MEKTRPGAPQPFENMCDTYAYILAPAIFSQVEFESLTSTGDLIEYAINSEDQADSIESIAWPWAGTVTQIAPVQLLKSWDPRPLILSTLGKPLYEGDSLIAFGSGKMYFAAGAMIVDPQMYVAESDALQLVDILIECLRRARRNDTGILFIGDCGWDYEIDGDLPVSSIKIIKEAGYKVLTRRS